ncbi:MAG: hypothetical protein AAF348_19190 [Bacteroidota bacterium]
MKKIKTRTIVVLSFASTFCHSQAASYTYEEDATYQYEQSSSGMVLRVSANSIEGTEGSPYLQEDWTPTVIYDHNKKKKVNLVARFNAYTKEIEIAKEEKIIALKPVTNIEVKIGDKIFVPFKAPNTVKTVFAEQLTKGKINLIKYYSAKIIKAATDAALLGIENKDKIKVTSNLYYKKEGEVFNPLPKSKNEIAQLIDNDTKSFTKKNKLSYKKEGDLIEIFRQYNSKDLP